ncbi:MAG: GNAT family N-acetyltransferase [Clostridiales bacterium]|nr:GNAT family N-acetyltransferase [Clostridiales bacterium]
MAEDSLVLKICTVSDKQVIRDLAERTCRDAFEQYNKKSDMDAYVQKAFSMEQMERDLANRHSRFILALQDGRAAGYVKLNEAPAQTDLHDRASLEIERIYVLRGYQNRGIGQRLLDEAIDWAAALGKAYVWLGVWEKNEGAMRFYARNGFIRFAEHAFLLGTDRQTDYLMRRTL